MRRARGSPDCALLRVRVVRSPDVIIRVPAAPRSHQQAPGCCCWGPSAASGMPATLSSYSSCALPPSPLARTTTCWPLVARRVFAAEALRHGDDDLAAGVSALHLPQCLSGVGHRVCPVQDGRELAVFDERG